ncbi:MAG: hypothetical protein HN411_01625 [Waddliaceae bacterium]|jgi:hypothetical protein|nr:hypothetical protein [Waddliaceae bacterium]MBT3578490.1 hypothetical protein [Waddliaceae bacterium]MBT4444930.1 hypothetical protein [Waddliaceae bacterium]MBT6927973.1 hypothetical protein [Waddliaceae bacterium]MBT7263911.1 hypothetical protein [Waddliaceae bacterium]
MSSFDPLNVPSELCSFYSTQPRTGVFCPAPSLYEDSIFNDLFQSVLEKSCSKPLPTTDGPQVSRAGPYGSGRCSPRPSAGTNFSYKRTTVAIGGSSRGVRRATPAPDSDTDSQEGDKPSKAKRAAAGSAGSVVLFIAMKFIGNDLTKLLALREDSETIKNAGRVLERIKSDECGEQNPHFKHINKIVSLWKGVNKRSLLYRKIALTSKVAIAAGAVFAIVGAVIASNGAMIAGGAFVLGGLATAIFLKGVGIDNINKAGNADIAKEKRSIDQEGHQQPFFSVKRDAASPAILGHQTTVEPKIRLVQPVAEEEAIAPPDDDDLLVQEGPTAPPLG